MRKIIALAVLAVGIATFASARNRIHSTEARYRIDLKGNTAVLAKDQPVARGSVVLFHRSSDGVLTSVPSEEVAAIRPLSAPAARTATGGVAPAVAGSPPLRPGDAVVLGTTGDGAPTPPGLMSAPASASESSIQGRQVLENQVFPGDLPGPSANGAAYGAPTYVAPNTNINPTLGGTAAANAATPVGANGFPATTAATPVGPNGFPATTATTPVGANGFPAGTTTGPQSSTQPNDTNGFPSLATPPSTSASPSTGASPSAPAAAAPANSGAAAKPATSGGVSAPPASEGKSGSGH